MAITFIPSITVKTDATYRTVQTFEDLLQDINVRFGADHDMVITKISTREEYSNSTVETYSVVGMVGKVVEVSSVNLAYFDDYRPGYRVVYKTCDGFKHITLSDEIGENAKVDATPDVAAEYKAHLAYKARKYEIKKRLAERALMKDQAKRMGFNTYHDAVKLKKAMSCDWYEVIKLMTSFTKGTIRSPFRSSLANQIFNWVNDPNPQFKKPLSPKQERTLVPYKPY